MVFIGQPRVERSSLVDRDGKDHDRIGASGFRSARLLDSGGCIWTTDSGDNSAAAAADAHSCFQHRLPLSIGKVRPLASIHIDRQCHWALVDHPI